jgi:hypothetical protein
MTWNRIPTNWLTSTNVGTLADHVRESAGHWHSKCRAIILRSAAAGRAALLVGVALLTWRWRIRRFWCCFLAGRALH